MPRLPAVPTSGIALAAPLAISPVAPTTSPSVNNLLPAKNPPTKSPAIGIFLSVDDKVNPAILLAAILLADAVTCAAVIRAARFVSKSCMPPNIPPPVPPDSSC